MEPLVKVISLGFDTRDELRAANDNVMNILFDIFENLTDNMNTSPCWTMLKSYWNIYTFDSVNRAREVWRQRRWYEVRLR